MESSFDKNVGALSAYIKGVLIANAGALWALLMLGGGRRQSIRSERSGSGMAAAMSASGADALPWSWKECTLPCVYEAYEFCLMLHPPHSEKSAEGASEGGFEGIEKVFAVVGLD
jgi:hypothetical protein